MVCSLSKCKLAVKRRQRTARLSWPQKSPCGLFSACFLYLSWKRGSMRVRGLTSGLKTQHSLALLKAIQCKTNKSSHRLRAKAVANLWSDYIFYSYYILGISIIGNLLLNECLIYYLGRDISHHVATSKQSSHTK